MAQLAAAAGLPKANLHYYFGTKEGLYRAVLEGILALWLDDAAEWIVPERHPADGLAGYVRAKMMHSRLRPDASRIFAGRTAAWRAAHHDVSRHRTASARGGAGRGHCGLERARG